MSEHRDKRKGNGGKRRERCDEKTLVLSENASARVRQQSEWKDGSSEEKKRRRKRGEKEIEMQMVYRDSLGLICVLVDSAYADKVRNKGG